MTLTCPTPDILRKLAFGRVPPDRERELDRHLSACALCRQAHDDHFRPIVDAVRVLSVNRSVRGAVVTVVAATPPALPATAPLSDLGSLGKFRLLEVLGEGGMGRVYRAFDTTLKCERALKVILLRDRDRATPDERRGLFAEAQAAARLNDDNIVSVLEAGEIDDTPYLVMPLLKGETLGGRLRRGPLPLYDLCRIGSAIARGLSAAHAAGLVHRDIKPGNIWLEPKPGGAAVRVLDFGLAQMLTEATAGMAGTPAYMAPEQAAGRAVDARADLFSLGAVLFEMASGKRLFPGGAAASLPALLASVKEFDAPTGGKLLPTVPPRLSVLIAGLLRNDPQRRTPSDAEELADTLTALASEFDPGRRRKQVMGLVRTAALIAASGLAVLGGVWAKKELLDAPVNLTRSSRPVERAPEEPKPVPQPPRQAIIAGDALANLDHFDRSQIPEHLLRAVGDGDARRAAGEVVAVLGPSGQPGTDDGHTWGIDAIALHPNGRLLATGAGEKTVRLWDLAAVPPKQIAVLREHDAGVSRLAFTTDGEHLVSGAADGRVVVWAVGSNTPVRRYHTKSHVTGLAVGRTRNIVAIGCDDGSVRVMNLDSDEDATTIRGNRGAVHGLAFVAADRRLIIGSIAAFQAVDMDADDKQVFSIPEAKVWFRAVAASPDGSKILANGYGVLTSDLLKTFGGFGNNHDTELQNALSVRSQSDQPVTQKVLRHGGRVLRAAFTPDGRRVVSTAADGNVHLWNWASEIQLARVSITTDAAVRGTLFGLAVHPDGRHAIVSRADGLVCVLRFADK